MNTNFMKLRDIMRTHNVTYYLVPSEDPHQSEYVDDHLNVDNIFQVLLVLPALFLQVPMKDGFGPTDVILRKPNNRFLLISL